MLQNHTFPQYRKYKNNKHFFKIISHEVFEEISFIGNKPIIHTITAKILPDRNFIADLLNDVGNTAEMSTAEEYTNQLQTQ